MTIISNTTTATDNRITAKRQESAPCEQTNKLQNEQCALP